MSKALPKVIARMADDSTPRVLHIPAHDVELEPTDDPNPRDRYVVKVEVYAGLPRPGLKEEKVHDLEEYDGKVVKVDRGRRSLSEPRWIYSGEVVPGSAETVGFEEAPDQLVMSFG